MQTLKLSELSDKLLTPLRALHGDNDAALTKALNEHIKSNKVTITGDDGKALDDVEFVVSGQTVKSVDPQAATTQTDGIDANALREMITKGVKDALDANTAPAVNKAIRAVVTGGETRNDDKKSWGWRDIGEFGAAVIKAVRAGRIEDERLHKSLEYIRPKGSLTSFVNEGIGEEGGFAIPPDYREGITEKVAAGAQLAPLCNNIPTGRNSVVMTKDETTPWQTSGGIQAYWGGEADTKTQSKIALKQDLLRLNKIYALVPITDEAAEDGPMLGNYIRVKAPAKIAFKIDLAIVQGTGVGQPLGILNAPSTIAVAKVGSQVADTVVGLNIIGMRQRFYPVNNGSVRWLANHDTRAQLETLMKVGKIDTGAADTGWGFMLPPVMYGANGDMTIGGVPVIFHQATETLGDAGDLFLVDFSQYDLLVKTGGIKVDESMHLWFDQDTTALRFVMRVAGQPSWSAPISPRDGSTTYSPFVTLAERA